MRTQREFGRRAYLPPLSLLVLLVVLGIGVGTAPATVGTGEVTGRVFEDPNRDGIWQSDEAVMAGRQLYVYGADGSYVGTTLADDTGTYSFPGLAAGDYVVECEASGLRQDWVPSTTGSADPRTDVHVDGSATADFGWRRIVRSTDLSAPLTTYVGANGVRIEMFNDALAPGALYDDLVSGSLVGPEASSVTIRFGYGDSSATSSGAQETNGVYSNYGAVVQIGWASWLNTGQQALFHEYGHAWSLYYAFIVQQDPTLSSYLAARGLSGDTRVNSSYGWSAREMIAEDYRELFGSAPAKGGGQMNPDVPLAEDVPGLRDFLASTYMHAPKPENTAAPTISGPAVRGQTVAASTGAWTASPSGYTYQWRRCDAAGENCTAIANATASSYVLQASDVGATVDVTVTASNAVGSGSATSAASAPVLPATATATFTGTLTNKKTSQSFTLLMGSGDAQAVLSFAGSSALVLKLQTGNGAPIASASGGTPVALSRSVGAAEYGYAVSLPQKARGNTSFTLRVTYAQP